ncbi:HAD-like domain-containing protein [Annulohypoxylon truncatum]|uniref:HAD-like domain-containing protein n=1 Tax=Annulohypoxylon truncatum TaxID=327061 RepID=UPI0020080F36|nr:HAD-like domain-containing protein [Annulohypoxylon truncatum]KAI1209391.1 HAD-like domain-containing protein [Annulohypoxylon truncatum]
MASKFKAIIFDLEGVLVEWQRPRNTKDFRCSGLELPKIKYSSIWENLNTGKFSLDDAYEHFAEEEMEEKAYVKLCLEKVFKSVRVNERLANLIRELNASAHYLKICVVANVCREHFEIMKNANLPWEIFSSVFISGILGMKKPDLCFFQHVINAVGLHPSQILMVDAEASNLCAARSFGIYGIPPDGTSVGLVQTLRNLIFNPLPRAEAFMKPRPRVFAKPDPNKRVSIVEDRNIIMNENISQLMIGELLGDRILCREWSPEVDDITVAEAGFYIYLRPEGPCPKGSDFHPNADITSIAYLSIPRPQRIEELPHVHLILEAMASNVDSDGILQTYFDHEVPRTDLETCCNILRLFYSKDRENDPRIKKTEKWVAQCIKNRAYTYGSRCYTTPETFLYFVARLWSDYMPEFLYDSDIEDCIIERLNIPTNALALAFRISACQLMKVEPRLYRQDLTKFVLLQDKDGGWPAGHFFRAEGVKNWIGNRSLTTALAIKIFRWEKANSKSTDGWLSLS